MTTVEQCPAATGVPADRLWFGARDEGRAHHPADLIVRRPDLYGVSTFADVVADSVLWAA